MVLYVYFNEVCSEFLISNSGSECTVEKQIWMKKSLLPSLQARARSCCVMSEYYAHAYTVHSDYDNQLIPVNSL